MLLLEVFDYWVFDGLEFYLGDYVIVLFGQCCVYGVVWVIKDGFGEWELKSVESCMDGVFIFEGICNFVDWVVKYLVQLFGIFLCLVLCSQDVLKFLLIEIFYVCGDVEFLCMIVVCEKVFDVVDSLIEVSVVDIVCEVGVSFGVVKGLVEIGVLYLIIKLVDLFFDKLDLELEGLLLIQFQVEVVGVF